MKSRIKPTGRRAAAGIALLFSFAAVAGNAQSSIEPVVSLPGHVPGIVRSATLQPRDPQAGNQPITFTVMLNLTDQAGFKAFEASLSDPNSPNYRHKITALEISTRFGPSPEAYATVLGFLEQNGFTLVEGSNNRRTITVRGTRAQAETAFHVTIADYKRGSFSFHSPAQDPSVPASLAPLIAGISGLSNATQPLPAATTVVSAPDTSTQAGSAYNGAITAAGLTNSGGLPPGLNGAGQTIGLIEMDNYTQSDLTTTLKTEGLSGTINQIKQYPVAGGTGVSGCAASQSQCGTTEALLDIAAVLGIAPGANVTVFVAPLGNLLQALNDAIDVVSNGGGYGGIISTSVATCESNVSSSDAQNMDALLDQYSASGLTLFADTGDYAGSCGGNGGTISFPADLPHAIAVGGTRLQMNAPADSYNNETWWSEPSGLGGGFGVSTIFPEPSYQSKLYAGAGGRSVPDVAADANPGILICQANSAGPGNPLGCWQMGGTSLATPLWAGVWALTQQAATDACGGFGLSSAAFNGYLYIFSGAPAFHPAASMGSDFQHVGLGSPDILNLIAQTQCGQTSVTSISPSTGPAKGGTKVTVEGSNLIGVTKVKFGNADATNVIIYSDSKLTAESPTADAAQVQIQVSAASASFTVTGSNTFTYVPQVTSVNPNLGPFYGGTQVTVTGLALDSSYTFKFGGNAATSVSCSNSTTCTMLTPAGAPGLVAVEVDAPAGKSPSANLFTYQPLTITNFAPEVGPTSGGLPIEIWGTSLKNGMTVHFGDDYTATATSCSGSTACMVNNPPAKTTGTVPLTVTVDGVTSAPAANEFTYFVFPTITSISPSTIPANTASTTETVTLTIGGTGFVSSGTLFTFDVASGGALANVKCSSSTQCTATLTIPAKSSGMTTEPLKVTASGNTSLDSVNLTFPTAPAVTPRPVCTAKTCS